MQTVILLFSGPVSAEEVYPILSAEGSGFQLDLSGAHRPLYSGAEIALAVAGLVVGASQLAVSLWQIKRHPQKGTVTIELQRPDGAKIAISGGTVEEVQQVIEGMIQK